MISLGHTQMSALSLRTVTPRDVVAPRSLTAVTRAGGTDHRPRSLPDAVAVVTVDGETVAWDEVSGALHHLDPVGSLVLSVCDGVRDDEAVVLETAARSGAPVDAVRPDVLAFLDRLEGLGLLRRDPA